MQTTINSNTHRLRIERPFDPDFVNHVTRVKELYLALMDELDAYVEDDPISVEQAKLGLETACMYHVKAFTAEAYLKYIARPA